MTADDRTDATLAALDVALLRVARLADRAASDAEDTSNEARAARAGGLEYGLRLADRVIRRALASADLEPRSALEPEDA